MGLAEKPSDDMLKKLVKRIPTDVVTMYLAAWGIAPAIQDEFQRVIIEWFILIVGFIGTIFIRYVQNKKEREKHKNNPEYGAITPLQYSFLGGTFLVWAIAIGSPFNYLPLDPGVPPVLVILWTFIIILFPVSGKEREELRIAAQLISVMESGRIDDTQPFEMEIRRLGGKAPKNDQANIGALIKQSSRWKGESTFI